MQYKQCGCADVELATTTRGTTGTIGNTTGSYGLKQEEISQVHGLGEEGSYP